MKNTIKISSIFLAALIMVLSSCSDFESINTNPDEPTKVTSGMLATNLILNIVEQPGTKGFLYDDMFSKYVGWNEKLEDYQYNKLGRNSFDGLLVLNNVDKMVDFAPQKEVKKSYQALGHFIRAYKFFRMSMYMGAIPYSEALKGLSKEKYKPEYDTQKQVFLGILNELEKANQLFAEGSNFDGDPIYGGDVSKWQKLVNTFELKVLINLYKKAGDSYLKVKQRFKEIVNNKPIFQSNANNFQLAYSDQEGQKYPWYKEGNNFLQYPMVSSLLISSLKELEDRRLFYYTAPSPVQIDQGKSASDWAAYKGTNVAAEFSKLTEVASSRDFSGINLRYSERPEGEPTYLLSYGQMNLILAEAAARGWIAGSGEDYYKEGIRADMQFVANHTPDKAQFHHNMPITDSYIDNYVNSSAVDFASSFEKQLQQIILQKYIMNYLQAPYTSYFEYRRTGYPDFPINPSSNLNTPSDQMPKRWMYPDDEYNHNSENVQKAVQRQFKGDDSVNAKMWLLRD